MIALWCIAAAAVFGLGNRIRGGLFPIPGGTQVGRMVGWGLPVGAAAALGGMPWWAAMLMALGAFLGCCVGQYGGLSLNHRGPPPAVSPWLTMTAWGVARVAGAALVLWWFGGVWPWRIVALSGLACAPIYWVVWHVPTWCYLKGFGYGDGPATGFDPPELAELLHGAVMGVALALALGAMP